MSYAPVDPVRTIQFFKDFHTEAKIVERQKNGEILFLEKDSKVVGSNLENIEDHRFITIV